MESPQLPTRFPCWVQAVYSWGGETSKDLGFIEGDLIECLNAGDGSWWVGRLKRDRRMCGAFPSNFVKVLENYQPTPRAAKPLPPGASTSHANGGPPIATPPSSTPQKGSGTFRKAFAAYASPDPKAAARQAEFMAKKGTPSPPSSVRSKRALRPYSSMIQSKYQTSMAKPERPPSPKIPLPIARASSPFQSSSRRPSESQSPHPQYHSRAPSRAPSQPSSSVPSRVPSRAPSPGPIQADSRAPSPRPDINYRSASPRPDNNNNYRSASPHPDVGYRSSSPRPQHDKYRAISPRPQQDSFRAVSPRPPQDDFRAPSPGPQQDDFRAPSPRPEQLQQFYGRASSPQPRYQYHSSIDYHEYSGRPSQESSFSYSAPDEEQSSPPPPPPPAHRTAYTRQHSPEPHAQTPHRHSVPSHDSPANSHHSGMTPSPLRDAMRDVMTSLEDMGMSPGQGRLQQDEKAKPLPDIWSPEAFEELSTPTRRPRAPTTTTRQQVDVPYEENQSFGRSDSNSQAQGQSHHPRLLSYVERMDNRFSDIHDEDEEPPSEHQYFSPDDIQSSPPPLPMKNSPLPARRDSASSGSRPSTSYATTQTSSGLSRSMGASGSQKLRHRKSALELGKERLNRTFTVKSSATNSTTAQSLSTNSTDVTAPSLMSGYSAGGFSATSAGSLARKKFSRSNSIKNRPGSALEMQRPSTAMSTISYHSSHATDPRASDPYAQAQHSGDSGLLGGLTEPHSPKKRGFFKKLGDKVKTSTATAKLQSAPNSRPGSPTKSKLSGLTGIGGGVSSKDASREMGLSTTSSGGVDWVQMRRDVNRSNSLSRNERNERYDRAQMMDISVIAPVEELESIVQGDEGYDGQPLEQSTDYHVLNLTMVDKSARFVANLPGMVTPASLAQNYVCRPHRSDVQKLRAIFTWVSERVAWEEDFEGEVDARRVIQSKRGCAKEMAVLVSEMCKGVGIHAEMVRGYLKRPSDLLLGQNLNDAAARPNHWWNAVLVDGEWRIMDCSLAAPTNPHRTTYSSTSNQAAEAWLFLARPSEVCYTHVPLLPEQQHMVPAVSHDILMALPTACPPFFKNRLQMWDFDTSLLYLEGLEMAHIQIVVPEEVECVAEVEARSFSQDADGDRFESGELVSKRALAQAEFLERPQDSAGCFKRYTIKAVLPSLQNAAPQATLKIYAGRRGLMHGINSNPHALAVTLPLLHEGTNPDFEFFTRHPTPHALRHELYVVGPQCKRLACNNTFVFAVRQHPASSSLDRASTEASNGNRPQSAMSIGRPGSAMSMNSASASGSAYSNPSATGSDQSGSKEAVKPAKLAIQTPSGKILRMTRKIDQSVQRDDGLKYLGSSWETVIKIGERGTWRGLVLADRSARWCVFGEWECV